MAVAQNMALRGKRQDRHHYTPFSCINVMRVENTHIVVVNSLVMNSFYSCLGHNLSL